MNHHRIEIRGAVHADREMTDEERERLEEILEDAARAAVEEVMYGDGTFNGSVTVHQPSQT